MSYAKPTAIDKATDAVLGCFSNVSLPESLDHLVRYLGTWSGSDKLFAIVEYTLKLLVPILHKRAQIQKNAGLRKLGTSSTAARFSKLAGSISNSRTLWRYARISLATIEPEYLSDIRELDSGVSLLTIIRWMISLEHNPQPTRRLLNIERLQGWSMFGYYPLEHLSYLASADVLPSRSTIDFPPFVTKKRTVELNAGKLSLWSVRCWAVYVVLQFAHLHEDRKLLQAKYRTIFKAGMKPAEKQEMQKRWRAYWSDLVVNMANFPLALHWSTGSRLIKQDYIVALLNLVVAVISFRNGWEATALPATPLAAEPTDDSMEPVIENVTGYES